MKRVQWLDIAKGIAILTVVIGHVSIIPWEPYRKIIFSFHMPLFFIAAGYTTKPFFSWDAVKKAAKRLLVPYLLTCLLIGIVKLQQGSNLQTEIARIFWGSGVPAQYGPGVPFTGAESIPTVGAIWFLPCMFFSKVLFTAFLSVTKSLREWLVISFSLIICIGGYLIGQHYKIPLCIDVALFNFVFLHAGYLFKKYNGIAQKSITAGVSFLVLWYLALKCNALELSARYYRDFPACIFSTAGAIAASYLIFHFSDEVLNKVKGLGSFLIWCGENSLQLLLIHHLDGLFWKSEWLRRYLPDISNLSALKQGCIIALCNIIFYVLLCAIWLILKKMWRRLSLLNRKKPETPND